jgi:LmbE family N-acetylglucosaminyl deacetylase
VTVISVYSGGARDSDDLSDYQRAALGFGSKAVWPNTEAFRRSNIPPDVPLQATESPWVADPGRIAVTQERAATQARQFWQRAAWTRSANITNVETPDRPLADSVGNQGSEETVAIGAADAMAVRRVEDERYAYFMESSLISLELPDAVFRGYVGDEQLLGAIHLDDPAPYDVLRREILRLEPQMVYLPLAVGHHVDHQQCREVGLALLEEGRRWVMPAPDFAGRLSFYEDFPYAWWNDFHRPADLAEGSLDLPAGLDLTAAYADIGDQLERKAAGLRLYASQVTHLFDSDQAMLDGLAQYHARVATEGGVPGYAERYWTAARP